MTPGSRVGHSESDFGGSLDRHFENMGGVHSGGDMQATIRFKGETHHLTREDIMRVAGRETPEKLVAYAWETPLYFFSVDIYTCKPFDPIDVVEFTVEFLDTKRVVAKGF